ncbi:unnamed protein product [Aureobasidium uvarum]|uniref:Pinin/SDK/MemA protein domain-containing protein n=1 Tax=Aureobasidium uvarum TaxID=2773716 RepID=A0A9N8KLG6_9PEZI|nr:unnamed protein product [Aureobasidium uvarum]
MACRVVSSAVVLPDATPSSPRRSPDRSQTPEEARAGTKRRHSSADHDSPKRQRLSPSPDRSRTEDQVPPARERRPVKPIDEKKRTQRLFGGLLGGLGQTRPANSQAAKRRAEQEERRRQKEQELSERQSERLEHLNLARKIEQRRIDEASIRIKHENLKAMSNFLTTSTEPKLYFKPWELLPEQEDQIKRQREDVDVQIDQELDDFDQVRQRWQNEDTNGNADRQENTPAHAQKAPNGMNHTADPAKESTATQDQIAIADPDTESDPVGTISTDSIEEQEARERVADDADRHRKESIDDTGDIVVEADEDTVIY